MVIAYLDESGDTGVLPIATSPIQPLFCILALAVPEDSIHNLTLEFLELKRRFFPGRCRNCGRLGRLLVEIKGADIRKVFREADRDKKAHHLKFLDCLFAAIAASGCRVFGRVWVKPIGGVFHGDPIYTSSVQAICATFHNLLGTPQRRGIVIADSRLKANNSRVSFSIFTQRFAYAGNPYSQIIETPVFAHSENHAMIQLCDLLCSGVVFPLASFSYCTGYVTNIHVSTGFQVLKDRYGERLRRLEHRYNSEGRWVGGIVVSDRVLTTLTQVGSEAQDEQGGWGVPGRIWSLWDIMNRFKAGLVCYLLDQLHSEEGALLLARIQGQGATPVPSTRSTKIQTLLQQAQALFANSGLVSCREAVESAQFYVGRDGADISSVVTTLNRLKADIIKALADRHFLRIADDRHDIVDHAHGFGPEVFAAFPSARDDIRETLNCLAAECATAAVFHSMRVAEIGLRTLAFDRRVQVFKNKATLFELPLELATWDQILKELEDAEKTIQGFPQTLVREEQFEFYHGAMMQVRRFKNVFRNGIMHARDSYDRGQAKNVSDQVREFMVILASKLKEGEQTPVTWV